jgi:glycogen operon protein
MEPLEVWPGKPYPLGASYDGSGTNFSIFSEVADRVELCLFDDAGRETRAVLPETTAFCRHGYLPGIEPGQRYGFRIHGQWAPEKGLGCNPAKLLLDPYAKAIEGQVKWDEAVLPYCFEAPEVSKSEEDSAPFVPKSIVINPFFEWGRDEPLRMPWQETIVYETHVKGLSIKHPDIPEEVRGTYAGLGHPAVIAYLKKLGVTAVELLPVHQFIHDKRLVDRGLRNYWGYNSIGFLAPHNEYSSRGQRGSR